MLVLNDGYRSNIVIILHDCRATSLCLGPIHRWGRVLAWLATSDRFYCPPRKNNWMKHGCLAQTSFTFQYCILLTCHPHTFPLTIFWRGRNFSSAALHVNVILLYFFLPILMSPWAKSWASISWNFRLRTTAPSPQESYLQVTGKKGFGDTNHLTGESWFSFTYEALIDCIMACFSLFGFLVISNAYELSITLF